MFVAIQLIIQMFTSLLRWRLNLTLQVSPVVQARALGEVGILRSVLLSFYSGTLFQVFIYWNRFIFNRQGAKK